MLTNQNNNLNNFKQKVDSKINHVSDTLEQKIADVEQKVYASRLRMFEMDKKIVALQKSTRTLFKIFSKPHNWLRSRSKFYYNWHLKPYASGVHWSAAVVSLIVAFLLSGYQLGFFGGARPASLAAAGIPKMINYQVKLTDLNNIPKPDGAYDMKFSIYDDPAAGNRLWTCAGTLITPTATSITITNGIFSILLGAAGGDCANALSLDFNSDTYYLGVTVGADAEMAPRKRIGAVGYSYNSDSTDGIHASTTATANYILPLDANVDFSLPDDSKVVFRDSGIFLQSGADGKLLLSSDGAGTDDITLSGTVTGNDTWTATNLSVSNQGTIKLYEQTGSGTNFVALQAGATLAGDTTYTLPTAYPALTGYVLSSTDAGVMSWIAQSSADTWTDGGAYLYPTNRESMRVYDAGGTDYIDIAHNGTDALITTANTGVIYFDNDINPSADDSYSLGDNTHRWSDIYLGPSTLHIGSATNDESQISYNTGTNTTSLQSAVDSTTGFQFLDADAGTPILNINTTDEQVGLGTSTTNELLTVAGNMSLLQTTSTPSTTTDYAKLYVSPPQGGNDADTKLLLHMNTGDGNQYFVDSASGAKTVTAAGNVQGDDSQYKFGYLSGLFDGSGDYLSLAESNDWHFGTGDFTLDFWTYATSNQPQYTDILAYRKAAAYTGGFILGFNYDNTNNDVWLYLSDSSYKWTSVSLDLSAWIHWAIVRHGTDLVLYKNGVSQGTKASSDDIAGAADYTLNVGLNHGGSAIFTGWMDEIRISKGTARWTGNFTPPTRPYGEEGILYVKDSAGTVESLRQNLWVSDGTNMAFSQGKILIGLGVEQISGYNYRLSVAGDASLGGIFASSNSSNYAIYGYQYSSSAAAIYGYNASSAAGVNGYSASSIGVYGASQGYSGSVGVRGYINDNLYGDLAHYDGSSWSGVYGYANGYSYGVYGYGTTYGVYGQAVGSGGVGVKGVSIANYGAWGVSDNYYGVGSSGVNGAMFLGGRGASGYGLYAQGGNSCAYLAHTPNGINYYGIYSCSGGGRDIAEKYSKEPGYDSDKADVLSISPSTNMTLRKSSIPYDPAIAGVYSTRPALLIGAPSDKEGEEGIGIGGSGDIKMKDTDIPLALAGRVAVKVNNENGSIHRGDYLTSSSTAGVAMKATRPGNCLGIAMEDFNGTNGTVTVFISLGWHDPYTDDNRVITALELTSSQDQDLTIIPGSGKAIIEGDLTVNNIIITGKLDVADSATFNSNIIVKGNVTFNSDTVGEAKIKAGDTEVQVSFDKEYETQPNIIITPKGENTLESNFQYTVLNQNTKGFKIKIDQSLDFDTIFNWHSFGSDSGKIFVSDGTTEPIEIVKP